MGDAGFRLWNGKIDSGVWMAQAVKRPTLDVGSGHDLTIHELEPHVRLWADSAEPAWDSLSPSLSAPPCLHARSHAFSLSLSLSLSLTKINIKRDG